jgi:hypothetical protein
MFETDVDIPNINCEKCNPADHSIHGGTRPESRWRFFIIIIVRTCRLRRDPAKPSDTRWTAADRGGEAK